MFSFRIIFPDSQSESTQINQPEHLKQKMTKLHHALRKNRRLWCFGVDSNIIIIIIIILGVTFTDLHLHFTSRFLKNNFFQLRAIAKLKCCDLEKCFYLNLGISQS